MDLRFSWDEFNGRVYPGLLCSEEGERSLYLHSLLTDDGGLGLDHHVPWLREGKAMCELVMLGNSVKECFTTELFAADISREGVWISDITSEPTDGVRFSLLGFVQILDDWIRFLERGQDIEKPSEIYVSSYTK